MPLTRSQANKIQNQLADVSLLTQDNSPSASQADLLEKSLYLDFSESSSVSSSSSDKMAFDRNYALGIIPMLEGQENFNIFIGQCDSIFDEFGASCESSLMAIIRAKIPAHIWSLVRDCKSYDDLKNKLIQKYGDDTPLSMMMTTLVSLHQKEHENLKTYSDRAQEIHDKLYALTESFLELDESSDDNEPVRRLYKKLLLDYYIKGIKDGKLRQLVMSNNFEEFTKASNYAKCMEIVFRSHDTVESNSKSGTNNKSTSLKKDVDGYKMRHCSYCNKSGHLENYCLIKRRNENMKQCDYCHRVGHLEKDCVIKAKNYKTKHTQLNEPGQGSSDQKSKKCNFCGLFGHWEADCRKKHFQQINIVNSKNEDGVNQIPPDILLTELARHFNLK